MTPGSVTPLWRQLQLTAKVLHQIRHGRSGTVALDEVSPDMRPGVQALSFAVLRSLGVAQVLLKLLAKRAPPAPVDDLLCTALALSCHSDAPLYDAFTLVNQTVEAAKRASVTKPQAPFINACLRRFLRERGDLIDQAQRDMSAQWNHPAWWITQLSKDWPLHWQSILAANNCHAPMSLRVNRRRIGREEYLEQLKLVGIEAMPVAGSGVQLAAAVGVHLLPGFKEGWVSVQDGAAQLAAPLLLNGLKPQPCLRVLDACAAPGGKTAHLLELADAEVTALELDLKRSERIHQNLNRLGLTAKVLACDAANLSEWWDGVPFDAVLLDAPCSASGVVRRHPDIRWLRCESDITQLVEIQARLLNALWLVLKPGGRLLYSTCSVFKAEGCFQIDAFLTSNTQAMLLDSPGHLLPGFSELNAAPTDNGVSDHDGFYYALLEKTVA